LGRRASASVEGSETNAYWAQRGGLAVDARPRSVVPSERERCSRWDARSARKAVARRVVANARAGVSLTDRRLRRDARLTGLLGAASLLGAII
jgi:hypothetical protein